MGRERTGGDFGSGKARQSATLWDVSIRSETAATEFQDRCLKPLGLVGCWVPDRILHSERFVAQATRAPTGFLPAEASS
jgi:hypothetical protein